MNFRLILLTSGLLTATSLLGGCGRDELAPWGFPKNIELNCSTLPTAYVGSAFTFDLNQLIVDGTGVAPFTWAVTGLPDGLVLDANTGVITGTATMEGDYPLVITVTDAAGDSRVFENCANLVVERNDAVCIDDTGTIPDGFKGIPYSFTMTYSGGAEPYTWEATGLPAGLTIVFDDANGDGVPDDTTKARLEGAPTETGTFNVSVTVTDATGNAITTQCGELVVIDPIQVDHGKLFADLGGCITVGDGQYDSLTDLFNQEILKGVEGDDRFAITCEHKTGRGNGSGDFDKDKNTPDTMPPGITFQPDTCTTGGAVTSSLAYGIYGFIVTFSQSTSASSVSAYVPYCAPQMEQAPTAYDIVREDTGTPNTFAPGVQQLSPGEPVAFGSDVPDPQVRVTYGQPCGGSCYYAFVFSYNTLSGMAMVSANPNAKFPQMGFEGFTHGLRFNDADPGLLDRFDGRAWVTNITYDYCIAPNDIDCGNSEQDSAKRADLVRQNGGGSNYYFSLVLLPTN